MATQVKKIESYLDCSEHLRANLGLLDLYLLSNVQETRQALGLDADGDFRGLFVSENDVNFILSRMPYLCDRGDPVQGPLAELIESQRSEIARRTQLSLADSVYLPLDDLRLRLGLGDLEILVLLLILAPEVDVRYGTLYAYIQEDVSRRSPSVNLALNLFCRTWGERQHLRSLLMGESSLVRLGYVSIADDSPTHGNGVLNKALSIDRGLLDFLLGQADWDQQQQPAVAPSWEAVVLEKSFKAGLVSAIMRLDRDDFGRTDAIIQLVGEAGSGKKLIAGAICRQLQRTVMIVDAEALAAADTSPSDSVTPAFRKALLHNSVICLDNFHTLLQDEARNKALLAAVVMAINNRRDLTILTGEMMWRAEGHINDGVPMLTLSVQAPDYQQRRLLWESHLKGHRNSLTDDDIRVLSGRFRLRGGQIRKAVDTARNTSLFRQESDGAITLDDLSAASRLHSNQRLSALAQKIEPSYQLDDIVLPADHKAQLEEIRSYFANMSLVYGDWGFQSKTNLGKGLNALFVGASGTGKTMAADVIAGQLGLDLYKIDLSTIVSKYIGETEKNLDRIFREAHDSNAILFFDEADALFGKRSEVKDSHDRYANIETSYLLQKMEEYQGIVVLATNFRKNMDDAFVRRMHFVIEFPVPEELDRLQIWHRVFPQDAPCRESVDIGFMAKQFKLPGGNIKNVAVTSAFLAAQDGEAIDMRHLILATRREYQKMGKLLIESEFGPYFELVRPGPVGPPSSGQPPLYSQPQTGSREK